MTVPAVEATEEDQSVVYTVNEVAAEAFVVEAVNEELEAAIAAAEKAIEDLEAEKLNKDNVKNFKEQIEAARDLVEAAKALDEDATIEHIADLEKAEALLAEVTAELNNVKATVNHDAKTLVVTGEALKLNKNLINITVYSTNDKGEKVVLTDDIVLAEQLTEENTFEAVIELADKTVTPGTYTVEVSIEDEAKEEATVDIDFTNVDKIVDAVNKAKSEIELEKALKDGGFDYKPENITEYNSENGLGNEHTTVESIQEKLTAIDKDLAETTLVEELKALAAGPQKPLLDKLQEKFDNATPDNIVRYQQYIAGKLSEEDQTATGFSTAPEQPSEVQKAINVINALATKEAAEEALTEATGEKLTKEPTKEAVQDAKNALEAFKKADEALSKAKEDGEYEADEAIEEAATAIEAAEETIEAAETAAKELADAIAAAKVAQKNFLLEGGKKDNKLYEAVDKALNADDETKNAEAIKNATDALVAATEQLVAIKETIPAAEKALADYKAAGGVETEDVYSTVKTNLDTLKGDEEDGKEAALKALNGAEETPGALAALNAATKKLTDKAELVEKTIAAAETALADYKAAGGVETEDVYSTVKTNLETLKAEESTDEAIKGALTALNDIDIGEDGAITALNNETKELVQVKAINDAIADEKVAALQEIILGVGSKKFADLSKAQRAELGEYIITQAHNDETVKEYKSTTEFKKAIDGNEGFVKSYQDDIKAFNTAANAEKPHGADAKTAVITAIEKVTTLEGLNAVAKLDLAEAILNAKPENGYAVETIAQIKALVEANK